MPTKRLWTLSRRWWIGLGIVGALIAGAAIAAFIASPTAGIAGSPVASALPPIPTGAASATLSGMLPTSVAPPPSPSGSPSPSKSPAPRRSTATPSPHPHATTTHPSTSGKSGTTEKFYVTLYGAHDNTPTNSTAIAYPMIHQKAGGTGTFADPITFATDRSELAPGTKIYYAYLKRYFIMEDDCTECDQDWSGKGPDGGPKYHHIDLWAGDSDDSDIEKCEGRLTQDGLVNVIVNPPSNLPVSAGQLYDNGQCYQPGK